MSSQDTFNSARSEEQEADILRGEVEKEQARIQAMQHDMVSEDQVDKASLQQDIDTKNQIIASLQQKISRHEQNANNYRQQAAQERQREQQEQQKKKQEGLLKKGAKEVIERGLF